MRSSAAVLLVACSGTSPEDTDGSAPAEESPALDPAPSFTERGPWAVGTEEVEIVGTNDLAITIQVWYPTTAESGPTVSYDDLLAGEAFVGVAPDCAEIHPMLAFSHGYGGIRYQSSFFTEFLASHGYVVVAPDHVGNTFVDPFGDLLEIFERRPTDIRDAVDWVFAEAGASGSAYSGCVDPADGYAVSGHSFGGYTAFAAAGATVDLFGDSLALGDDRVWGVVAMAPWNGEGAISDGTREITAPTLVLTGALDETTTLPTVEGMWDALTVEPRYLGVFPEAGHYSFSPVACLLETGDGCGAGFLPLETFTPIVETAGVAFLEGIRGVPGAIEQLPLDAVEVEWTTAP